MASNLSNATGETDDNRYCAGHLTSCAWSFAIVKSGCLWPLPTRQLATSAFPRASEAYPSGMRAVQLNLYSLGDKK